MNATDRVDELNQLVTGWMTPVYYRDDPVSGRRLNGLGPADFRKVVAGYACPQCLAEYKTYLPKCPVCRYERDVIADVQAPPEDWTAHLDNLRAGGSVRPRTADEFFASLDPDAIERL